MEMVTRQSEPVVMTASYPGNVEICDPAGRNEDCDPLTVGRRDTDGDGYIDSSCYNTGPDGKRIYDRSRH